MSISGSELLTIHIVSLVIQSIFYGLYLVSCAFCAGSLLTTGRPTRWRRPSELKGIICVAALALLINSTFNMALGVYRNLDAFVYSSPDNPVLKLGEVDSWFDIVKAASLTVQTLIGDAILIWRTYVVYQRSFKIIILSLILFCGDVFCAVMAPQEQAELKEANSVFRYKQAFWGLTVAQNIITTSLLIWRIWRVNHQNRGSHEEGRPSQLRRVLRTIAGSGIIFTILTTVVLGCVASSSMAVFPTSAVEFMIVGIVFNLFIIRARSDGFDAEAATSAPMTTLRFASQPHASESTISGSRDVRVYHSTKAQGNSQDAEEKEARGAETV